MGRRHIFACRCLVGSPSPSWRSGRVVEGTGLENRQGRKALGGSNPSSSASQLDCKNKAPDAHASGASVFGGSRCASSGPLRERCDVNCEKSSNRNRGTPNPSGQVQVRIWPGFLVEMPPRRIQSAPPDVAPRLGGRAAAQCRLPFRLFAHGRSAGQGSVGRMRHATKDDRPQAGRCSDSSIWMFVGGCFHIACVPIRKCVRRQVGHFAKIRVPDWKGFLPEVQLLCLSMSRLWKRYTP